MPQSYEIKHTVEYKNGKERSTLCLAVDYNGQWVAVTVDSEDERWEKTQKIVRDFQEGTIKPEKLVWKIVEIRSDARSGDDVLLSQLAAVPETSVEDEPQAPELPEALNHLRALSDPNSLEAQMLRERMEEAKGKAREQSNKLRKALAGELQYLSNVLRPSESYEYPRALTDQDNPGSEADEEIHRFGYNGEGHNL